MTEKNAKETMKTKTIALIAHDNKKPDIIRWAQENKVILSHFNLCGTGTTAKLIAKETGLTVQGYLSGPLGGDLEIGAKVAERKSTSLSFSGILYRLSRTTPTLRHYSESPRFTIFR